MQLERRPGIKKNCRNKRVFWEKSVEFPITTSDYISTYIVTSLPKSARKEVTYGYINYIERIDKPGESTESPVIHIRNKTSTTKS